MAERILVVDDHLDMANLVADQLTDLGYRVQTTADPVRALELARREMPHCVLTDLRMPGLDGFDLLHALHAEDPDLPVLIMTAFATVDTAVEAMRRGAWHYLTKPFSLDELGLQVARAVSHRRVTLENKNLRELAHERTSLHALVGSSPTMQALYAQVRRVARAPVPVLVRGESGSGKELVARAIHLESQRSGGPFVAVNCTALPAALLESELFGHERGAFTGANQARKGLFREADGGTLFLDEIGDMPIELQSRLLRVLEDGHIRPVGTDKSHTVSVRILAATHQPLEARVAEGRFREDLLFRLDVVPIHIPPLRERAEDIPLLVRHLLAQFTATAESRVRRLSPDLLAALARRPWPGNVRELKNVVHRIAVLGEQEVAGTELLDAPGLGDERGTHSARASAVEQARSPSPRPEAAPDATASRAPRPTETLLQHAVDAGWSLRQLQAAYVDAVLKHTGGNRAAACELLGVDASTLYRWTRRSG